MWIVVMSVDAPTAMMGLNLLDSPLQAADTFLIVFKSRESEVRPGSRGGINVRSRIIGTGGTKR
jgi:hypothetical protein